MEREDLEEPDRNSGKKRWKTAAEIQKLIKAQVTLLPRYVINSKHILNLEVAW